MTPREFRQEQEFEFDHFQELTNTGIKPNYVNIELFAHEYHKRKLKLLGIGGVSKSFALGKTVMVNRCIYGHEFNLGETVDIVDYEPSQTTSWLCSNGKNQWWLSEDEANVC